MKIIKKFIDFKQKQFTVKVALEEYTDDLWNLFNIMNKGDFVFGTCRRKITKETLTGVVKNERRKLNLLIKIEVSQKHYKPLTFFVFIEIRLRC